LLPAVKFKSSSLIDSISRRHTLRPAIDIFEPEDGETLACLSRTRPAFPKALDTPPAPGERPFASLADLATATLAVSRAAAAVEMVTGLGIRPQQLVPEALEALASADSPGGTKITIDPASIDTGVLARTILVARLVGDQPSPLVVLPRAAIEKFKKDFNSDVELPVNIAFEATNIIRGSGHSSTLDGASREVAARWIASLCPLGPVLGNPRP